MAAKQKNVYKRNRGRRLADVSKPQKNNIPLSLKNQQAPRTPAPCQSAAIQRQRILAWLLYSSITTLEAREILNIMHPAQRVLELKRYGHRIRTEWTTEYSAGGSRHRIARYVLQAEEVEA